MYEGTRGSIHGVKKDKRPDTKAAIPFTFIKAGAAGAMSGIIWVMERGVK